MQRRPDSQGITLVEVLVASALLIIALSPLVGLFAASRQSDAQTSRQITALALARSKMDAIVSRDWDTIPTGREVLTEPPFTVTVRVSDRRLPYLKDVWVEVSWTHAGDEHSVALYPAVSRRG